LLRQLPAGDDDAVVDVKRIAGHVVSSFHRSISQHGRIENAGICRQRKNPALPRRVSRESWSATLCEG
jgi:hypothetical protein